MRPNFLMIGAQKAATSTLWSILKEHPAVFLPELKETNFLLGGRWSKRGLAWYESLYRNAADARCRGEASPGYSMFPVFRDVPERAFELMPEARIIYIIRHPVQRMISHWNHATTAGNEHRRLNDALTWSSFYYFTSCYGLQLSRWAARFPREALLVVRTEDLQAEPGPTVDTILAHLGLRTGWRPSRAGAQLNRSAGKLRASPGLRAVSGALRGAGMNQLAVRVAKNSRLKQRLRLMRPYQPSELSLSPELETALTESFRADFDLLRDLVGPSLDLYGIA